MKIFYNNKVLILKPLENQMATDPQILNSENLSEFLSSPKRESTLYYKTIEKAEDVFKSNFKYIEAAGGIVFNFRKHLLVIKRHGLWDLPKGKIEKNEQPAEAAIREVMEECGVSALSIQSEWDSVFHIYQRNSNLYLKRTYWFEMILTENETLTPQTEEDISEVCWKTSFELNDILQNTYLSLHDNFKRALSIKTA